MATSVALPPFSALHADLKTSRFAHMATSPISCTPPLPPPPPRWTPGMLTAPLMCGFESRLTRVKTEPVLEECMESFCNNTYTELTSATFSQIKQGHTDLYGGSRVSEGEGHSFDSWTFTHPEHWGAGEVLDWVYSLTEVENFNGAVFRGEAFNSLTGPELCRMSLHDFLALDAHYGARVYEVFQMLLRDANFKKPVKCEALSGNVPDFACLESSSDDVTPTRRPLTTTPPPPPSSSTSGGGRGCEAPRKMSIVVSLDGLGLYDIDIALTGPQTFDNFTDILTSDKLDDSDYNSGSDADTCRSNSVSSDGSEPMFTDDEDSSSDVIIPDLTRNTHTPGASSDSGNESDDRRTSGRRRAPSASKGNHLWEFVRDLLKDARFNPALVKWEDKEQGVFKFVQSEAVAQMWGRKKNNPGMTYEKLSRAMRFCRSAGYFANVPRTGRFPKKLCFKFGPKAHDWLE